MVPGIVPYRTVNSQVSRPYGIIRIRSKDNGNRQSRTVPTYIVAGYRTGREKFFLFKVLNRWVP